MIIVEGPDGAGKSTLVKEICERFNLWVGERAVKDRKRLYEVTRQDTYSAMAEELRGNAPPKVWDRLFFSEMVYAPIVGRECEFTSEEQYFIRRFMELIDCPIILCHPPYQTVVDNALKDEQMDGVNENIEKIFWDYLRLKWPRQVRYYDYTQPEGDGTYFSHAELMRAIEGYITSREFRTW